MKNGENSQCTVPWSSYMYISYSVNIIFECIYLCPPLGWASPADCPLPWTHTQKIHKDITPIAGRGTAMLYLFYYKSNYYHLCLFSSLTLNLYSQRLRIQVSYFCRWWFSLSVLHNFLSLDRRERGTRKRGRVPSPSPPENNAKRSRKRCGYLLVILWCPIFLFIFFISSVVLAHVALLLDSVALAKRLPHPLLPPGPLRRIWPVTSLSRRSHSRWRRSLLINNTINSWFSSPMGKVSQPVIVITV